MLSTKVGTAAELMSIALRAERDAVKRYSRLASEMRAAGNESAAALFERMVNEEREHERHLRAWMERESIEFNPGTGPVSWRHPQVSTTYNDEARDPNYSTPYKALAFAVNNEENAFRFYTHVAAHAEDEKVRQYAESLAREELAHAALFRAERRRAYHAERANPSTASAADPATIHSEFELLSAALEIDRYFSRALAGINSASPRLATMARETGQRIGEYETRLNDLAPAQAETRGKGIALALAETGKAAADIDAGSQEAALRRLTDYCDQSFVFYDAIVETAQDEPLMQTAQALSSAALDRIGVLHALMGRA